MKKIKIIHLAALLFLSTALSAQYQSIFGKTQTSWKMNSWDITPEFISCNPDSMWVVYGNDTTFKGKTFKPLKEQRFFQQSPMIVGFISEDTSSGKVWFRNYRTDTILHLLMDMSLTVNDTFYFDYGSVGIVPSVVDTVFYFNSRKIIELDYKEGVTANRGSKLVKYTMIEGVGVNTRGVHFDQGNAILKHQWKDSLLNYNAPLDSIFYCDSLTSSLTEKNQSELTFELFPNPVNQSTTIELGNLKAEKIELFDINGSLVKIFPKRSKLLDLSDVNNGLYFLRVSTEKQGQFNKKIVVQK